VSADTARPAAGADALAFIALGSNLGDSSVILREAANRLAALSTCRLLRSCLWRSAPVDCPPGAADFLNAVVGLGPQPGETPASLLVKLQKLERDFGRRANAIRNESRTLDLDLIVFRDAVEDSVALRLPHPRAVGRRFVLAPLAEIAPDLVLPGQLETVSALLEKLPSSDCVRTTSDW
jgi:2-amino-4-hydroxy-6-hydroxymethyldihydropteridine diphosphokinase